MTREELEDFIRRNPSPALDDVYALARIGATAVEMFNPVVKAAWESAQKSRRQPTEQPK